MKTKILKHRVPKRILIGMLLVLFCFTSKAQTWENIHFNVDWQMNVPLNSNFADKFSGWGMNFEGKYDLSLIFIPIKDMWTAGPSPSHQRLKCQQTSNNQRSNYPSEYLYPTSYRITGM